MQHASEKFAEKQIQIQIQEAARSEETSISVSMIDGLERSIPQDEHLAVSTFVLHLMTFEDLNRLGTNALGAFE
ncbi:hypothetical protein [Xanthomonas rydalmerensis]|uniref:Uncharacterized protein n=1 Tax=Xanthomonas rydalmerensis TaxID=3046274 RepID=A0ABZ0JNF1_9XANT|nr:hypothetical protein [Xanthomonas sp. DM-2023]WOS40518.1 hypothetical protein QN243_19335 [Xanthomonas sp. DM-2023]WOS44702.1 hypothetical protein QN242_19335 [Xanthomonas sp. DM-2023]WOS48882.1 hypothetical protein QN240_19335 [Xanthomonas sp. DM-2023]WOS53062.1 hypothetical protein QN244_19340 [Xanthomonas sp. DM-2023]WOS57246.1 hypothetical protein QN245_19335 [Xanthomonas sp. DM-2023]